MKTIVLHIHADDQQAARLQCALDLAHAFEGHIVCAQVTPLESYVAGDPMGGVYALPGVLDAVRAQAESERERIEAAIGREGVSWDWQALDGNVVQTLVSLARLADIVVLSQPGDGRSGPRALPVAGDVALYARSPVLAIPVGCKGLSLADTVVVAWNGSYEASHALRLSLPMLRIAGSVAILEVTDEPGNFPATDAAAYLSRHGIGATIHRRPRGSNDVATTLGEAAAELRAAYMVMGAYGHSRLRETVFGGVTRSLINASALPLLLAH